MSAETEAADVLYNDVNCSFLDNLCGGPRSGCDLGSPSLKISEHICTETAVCFVILSLLVTDLRVFCAAGLSLEVMFRTCLGCTNHWVLSNRIFLEISFLINTEGWEVLVFTYPLI